MINKNKLKLGQKILFTLSFTFIFNQIIPAEIVYAKEVNLDFGRGPAIFSFENHPDTPKTPPTPVVAGASNNKIITNTLPSIKSLPYYETYITTTAYNSLPNQTDDSPFIAAWGDHVFWGMVASNCLPKDTKIQIPEYFGDKVFTVKDRMNKRYCHRIDIWMPEYGQAKEWGIKYVKIRIFK